MTWLNDAEVKTLEDKQIEFAKATKQRLTSLVQKYLDDTAKERNYDNILSLTTYATSSNDKFKAEGQAGVVWRDEVWSESYKILEDVEAGIRPIPEDSDLLEELPKFTWPA